MKSSHPLLKRNASAAFGTIPPGDTAEFYRRLNDQVVSLCRSLPSSTQGDAMFFCMSYAGLRLGDSLDFFKNFHQPVWSILYWIIREGGGADVLPDGAHNMAIRAHATAMLLHSLDDHLVDGQIPVSHLLLLMRSQAWRFFMEDIEQLCLLSRGSDVIASELIDRYTRRVLAHAIPESLEHYCDIFRGQTATGLIVPLLVARSISHDGTWCASLEKAYESFGIAWRLLDDLQDLESDMSDGTRSAVYVCLDDKGRSLWDALKRSGGRMDAAAVKKILTMMHDASVAGTIAARIVKELSQAAEHADGIGLGGLAEEFRTLAGPLTEWRA